jgi:hypothetical protein
VKETGKGNAPSKLDAQVVGIIGLFFFCRSNITCFHALNGQVMISTTGGNGELL